MTTITRLTRGQAYSKKFLEFVRVSPEVQRALENKSPVVALESATISHPDTSYGLPSPENVNYAIRAEQIIRQTGAIPATISMIGGYIRIGTALPFLSRLGVNKHAHKISRRDLPFVLGMDRMSGGCTVAATMAIAEMVGIKVLATGGIGGVHRAATLMMDISADVGELGRTNVAVVCSGPKPYLDAEGTIEFLENRGVPVATFKPASPKPQTGNSLASSIASSIVNSGNNPMGYPMGHPMGAGARDMYQTGGGMVETMVPAFYSHTGRVKSPLVIESAKEAARIIHASHEMGLVPGQLFCNPIPRESEVNIDIVEKSTRIVFKAARKKNKRNKEDIQNIVYQIRKFARGEAVIAEKAILLSNARMGAQIAVELSLLEGGPGKVESPIPELPNIPVRRPPSSANGGKQAIKWGSKDNLKRNGDSKIRLKGSD